MNFCDWHNAVIPDGERYCFQCRRIVDDSNDPEHLDAKSWTKRSILSHMWHHDDGLYYTSRTTKNDLVRWHQNTHERLMKTLDLVEEHARSGFLQRLRDAGCTRSAHELITIEDAWIDDHIERHHRGDEVVKRCS